MKIHPPLLEVEGLSVTFSGTAVVDDVSFTVRKGECIGIVGASGSGKSVTSLALMRLLDEKAAVITGSIRYKGREILDLPEHEFRSFRGSELAMVFQEPMTALDPVYSVGEQVAEAIRSHTRASKKEARQQVIRLFEEVLLPDPIELYERYPHQLSGGQKQRVVIAMALSCAPSILICDEPTTALDVLVQREILDLLERIQKEREMAMLFITHDLGVVREIAQRALVMYKGRVVEDGSVEDVFVRPQHPYTRGLIACRPDPTQHPVRLPTLEEVMRSATADPLIIPRITREQRAQRLSGLMAQEPLLKVEGLDKSHARRSGMFSRELAPVHVLREIGFSLYPGETLGVVGGSGSGKTTLGRSILRLIEPTNGHVWYRRAGSDAPQELTGLAPDEMRLLRKELQIIFQDPYSSLNPRITIGRAIMEAMQVHGLGADDAERKNRIMSLLARVGLEATHFDRFPHQFSGGQRQRVVIARAIALEPRLITCDESVAALDVSVQAQVLNLLNELKKEHGLTYIFISHDLSVVKYFCDRVLVLEKGNMVELRSSDAIYDDPQAPYTRRLLEAIPGRSH